MTAVSIVGLIALIIFTCFLVTITIIVVRHRRREGSGGRDKAGELEQYRRVPLIPLDHGASLCCDTAASSTKSCSCYSRSVSEPRQRREYLAENEEKNRRFV